MSALEYRMGIFDLGGAVNASADWLCGSRAVGGLICNPVATALLLLAIIAVIGIALYREPLRAAGARRAARAAVYAFAASLAVLSLHHYAVLRAARREASRQGVLDTFSSIELDRVGRGDAGTVPVRPALATGGAELGGLGFAFGPGAGSAPASSFGSGPGSILGFGSGAGAGSEAGFGAYRPATGAPRPDNVALPLASPDALTIEDVVVPAARAPPPRQGAPLVGSAR